MWERELEKLLSNRNLFKVWDKVKFQIGNSTFYTTIACIGTPLWWVDSYYVVYGTSIICFSKEQIKMCTEREIDNYFSSN